MSEALPISVTHIIDAEKCTGCGTCADVCPQQIIEIIQVGLKKRARVKDIELCVVCQYCQKMCPYGAVTVELPGITL